MKKSALLLSLATASLTMLGSASSAAAQSWSAMPGTIATTSPLTGFWNNPSDDKTNANLPCNVGGILTSAPGIAGCVNQTPSNHLPIAGLTAPTQYFNNAGNATTFFFGAGSWDLKLLATVTGANPVRPWSIVEIGSGNNLGTITTLGSSLNVYTSMGFYLTISAWAPAATTFSSNAMNANGKNQFALFGGPVVSTTGNQVNWTSNKLTYYVGMEDNACTSAEVANCRNASGYPTTAASDYDYNDIVLSVTAVPEPSSVALMAAGLLGLAVAARRRRSA